MDLRIIKTQKAIRQAFIDLLTVKDYDEITIQDILQKALINRATFYKYYSGKSDLAGQMIDEFKQKIREVLNDRLAIENQNLQTIMENHGKNMFEHRHQILALWKIRTQKHNLYQDMFCMSKQNFIELAKKQPQFAEKLPTNIDYQATMVATMMMATFQYYMEQDMPMPNDLHNDWQQMIDIIKI